MSDRRLFDTDVLVEYLRDRPGAAEYLESVEGRFHVSVVTVAELFSGARESEEEPLHSFLRTFEILPITEHVAALGGRYRREYAPSHGTGLGDALIAATATRAGCRLITFNDRHFPMLDEVEVPYRR